MAQLNLNLTAAFEKSLARLMRLRGFKTKSEAIRAAVAECLQSARQKPVVTDFRSWIGLGLQAPLNPNPRFKSHDELWESKG